MASFSYVFIVFWPLIPQKNPARFARRIASFPHVSLLFDPKYPKNNPGALRAPDGFIFLCFVVLTPNTQFSRRASRAGLLHFPMFVLLPGP